MTVPVRILSEGGSSALNVAAAVNLFKGVGQVCKVIVNTSAAAATSIIDSAGTTATAANTILVIPASAAVGVIYNINWPVTQGLSIVPGAATSVNVSYSSGVQG